MRVKILLWTLVIGVLIYMPCQVSAEEVSDYTLLIYMNGSDLESDYGSATIDLLEMIEGYVSEDVAVIIQTGGTEVWHSQEGGLPDIDEETLQRWRLTDDGLVLLDTQMAASMGASKTLLDFMNYGKSHYPSDQYGLILWNHGAGAIYGYGADQHFDYDTLTLEELQTAMSLHQEAYPGKFDFVGFDACLMASLETAVVLSPYADYLIGSEELEPVHGWYYGSVLNAISDNADPSPKEVGRAIVDGFVAQAVSVDTRDAMTVSVVDLSKIQAVSDAADSLFQKVSEGLLDGYYKEDLMKARLASESYGEGNDASDIPDSDMVDLIDYATNLNDFYPHQAEQVVMAVKEAVVINVNSTYKPNAGGLSVYIPARDLETMTGAGDFLDRIGISAWQAVLVRQINTIINGATHALGIDGDVEAVDDEMALSLESFNIMEGNDGYFLFNLGEENLSAVSQVNTIVGRVEANGDIRYLRKESVEDGAIMEDGTVIGETADRWVKINGVPVAMYFESSRPDGTENYYIPITLNGEDADLIVIISETYPYGKILGARKLNTGNQNVYNRSLIALESSDVVEAVCEYDAYNLLSGMYHYNGWFIIGSIDLADGLQLSWHPLPEGEYAYAFEVVDIYGNQQQTDWIIFDQTLTAGSQLHDNEKDLGHLEGTEYDETFQYPWDIEGADKPSEWAVPHVNTAFNNGLVTLGTEMGFTNDITRVMFCDLVVNMYEKITGEEVAVAVPVVFNDTESIAVSKAYALGIVSGYGDGRFGPRDLITREQLIAMFYRSLVRLDADYEDILYPEMSFSDRDLVSDWALVPASAMVYYDLINGVGENQLAPGNNATVEQSLKLVNGVYEFYVSNH